MKKIFISFLFLSLAFVAKPSLRAEKRELLTPAEMLKKLQESDDEGAGQDETEEHSWPDGLPKDLPLYPGVKHLPVSLGVQGYYRWNIQAPTADREKIIEAVRQGRVGDWKLAVDQKQSENIHLLQFSRDGESLVVTVSNDGTETKTVFYEFITDAFKERVSKQR